MMKLLQKTFALAMVLNCLFITNKTNAQTNLLTVSPSFESGSGVGMGSSLDGGSWARTGTNVVNYIYRQGLGNSTGAPVAYEGNYYLEAVTPNDPAFDAYDKLTAGNSQNLITSPGKGKIIRVFFHYQNSASHSFKAIVVTSNGGVVGELAISDLANDWTEATFDYEIPSGASSSGTSLKFQFGLNAGTTRIDNVRIYDVATLPVDFKSFEVKRNLHSVELSWETTNEINNSHYEIMRSSNGKDFTFLQSVQALNSGAIYNYKDVNPMMGQNYYKLVQYDLNGTMSELGIRAVNFSLEKPIATVYPNPFSNEINVVSQLPETKSVSLKLMDASGKLIRDNSFEGVSGHNSFKIQTNDLLPGIYILLFEKQAIKVYKK